MLQGGGSEAIRENQKHQQLEDNYNYVFPSQSATAGQSAAGTHSQVDRPAGAGGEGTSSSSGEAGGEGGSGQRDSTTGDEPPENL